MRVDDVDVAEIPARVAHQHPLEVAQSRGHLEAASLDAEGGVGAALGTPLCGAKRVAQRIGVRRGAPDVGALEIAAHGRDAQLLVEFFVVLEFDPSLGRLVEEFESELLDAFEHGHQARFDLGPERFLLSVLVRTFNQRRLVHDGEIFEPLHGLGGPSIAAPLSLMRARGKARF